MEINIISKLNSTRNLLQELGNSVSHLVNSSPDIFDDPGIKSCLEGFLTVYQEAIQRLENPSFRIAALGTTSSGKSTIVNALIGRKIAPIEAGEMSGGVLTIKHSQERKLFIAETEDAAWETGEWTGLSDDDLYQRIRTVMHSYHNARKKREYVAPQVTAYVPLLPACDFSLLGLPPGIEVELIDLPGLKSVQDRTNLVTIQQQVNKAFSLVALDYMQVDDAHRKRLLEELKKVVEYLQGSTDSMIFILNRVDQRGADDLPLEVRINKLREEVKDVLSLSELPEILPFNARLLYYAQCAWGAGAFNETSQIDQQIRLKFIQAMFRDCIGAIRLSTEENEELRNWFFRIDSLVCKSKPIDDETMRQILRHCLEWSGGRELWKILRIRLEKSFTELVIIPVLMEVFQHCDILLAYLNNLANIRKIEWKEEVEREKDKIYKIRQTLHNSSKKKTEEFKNDINKWVGEIKSSDKNKDSRVRQEAQEKGLKLDKVLDTVQDIEKDLALVLIVPVIDALKNNQSAYDLEEKLSEAISPTLARHIAQVYDNLSRRLGKFEEKSEFLVRRVRSDDKKGLIELEHDERYVRLLYSTMRQAIEARSSFLMQAKGQVFIQALDSFTKTTCSQFIDDEQEVLSIFNIEQTISSIFIKKLLPSSLNLPEEFFNISPAVKTDEKTNKVKTGQKDGSCGKKIDKYDDIKYKRLHIPNIDGMKKQWLEGITQAKMNLWDIYSNWIIQQLNQTSELFKQSVNEITDLAERTLNEQLNIIEQNNFLQQQFWQDFEIQKDAVTAIYQDLQIMYKGKNYE